VTTTVITATDVLLRDTPDRERLRNAVARAFGIARGLVTVGDAEGDDPIPNNVRILLLRQPLDMPGDFPVWYHLSIDPDLASTLDPAFDAVAHILGTTILTDAEDYFEMSLHLPDGSNRIVDLSQDDDGAFRLSPDIRSFVERATRQVVAS